MVVVAIKLAVATKILDQNVMLLPPFFWVYVDTKKYGGN
jgi:hypothetical protein